MKIFLATREEMENKRIDEAFSDEFFAGDFWLYRRTMFVFEEWHSTAMTIGTSTTVSRPSQAGRSSH